MKDLNNKFLSLLRYVPYLVDEKPKVQRFLSYLPYHIKDKIEYDNPKTLEEAMRKSNFCFEQNRKKECMSNWKAKKNNNQYEQKKKDFVPNRNSKNNKVSVAAFHTPGSRGRNPQATWCVLGGILESRLSPCS